MTENEPTRPNQNKKSSSDIFHWRILIQNMVYLTRCLQCAFFRSLISLLTMGCASGSLHLEFVCWTVFFGFEFAFFMLPQNLSLIFHRICMSCCFYSNARKTTPPPLAKVINFKQFICTVLLELCMCFGQLQPGVVFTEQFCESNNKKTRTARIYLWLEQQEVSQLNCTNQFTQLCASLSPKPCHANGIKY